MIVSCYCQFKGESKEFSCSKNAKINLQIDAKIGLATGNNCILLDSTNLCSYGQNHSHYQFSTTYRLGKELKKECQG